jgi:hypothetical protein
MQSNSRGSVHAVSPDVADKPAIRFNYLSTREDEEEWVQAIQKAREILRQPAFSDYDGGETSPGPAVCSPEDILAWVRRDGETAYHPSCTCKMGSDDMSVVDPSSMRVRGLQVRPNAQPFPRCAARIGVVRLKFVCEMLIPRPDSAGPARCRCVSHAKCVVDGCRRLL